MTYRTAWGEANPEADTPPGGRRQVWILLAIAVLVVGIAAAAAIGLATMSADRLPQGFDRAEGPLFPGFAPQSAAEVVVESSGGRMTLVRRSGGWVLGNHDGFPARAGAVEDLLRRLAATEMIYMSKPDARLPPEAYGLRESGRDGAAVSIHDSAGRPLLEARFGRIISEPGGEAITMTAVRRAGDTRIVLARGEIAPRPALERWTSTFVMHYLAPQIGEAVPAAPRGAKPAKVEQDELGRIRTDTGKEAERGDPAAGKAAEVTRALENVRFEDVRAAGAVPGDAAQIGTARYRTRDGVRIAVHLTRVGRDAVWARFEVDPSGASGEAADAAGRLRDQVDGWAFRLPKETADRMIVARDQLTP